MSTSNYARMKKKKKKKQLSEVGRNDTLSIPLLFTYRCLLERNWVRQNGASPLSTNTTRLLLSSSSFSDKMKLITRSCSSFLNDVIDSIDSIRRRMDPGRTRNGRQWPTSLSSFFFKDITRDNNNNIIKKTLPFVCSGSIPAKQDDNDGGSTGTTLPIIVKICCFIAEMASKKANRKGSLFSRQLFVRRVSCLAI